MSFVFSFLIEIVDGTGSTANVVDTIGWARWVCPVWGGSTPPYQYYSITQIDNALFKMRQNMWISSDSDFGMPLGCLYSNQDTVIFTLEELIRRSGEASGLIPYFDMSPYVSASTSTHPLYYRLRNKSGSYMVSRNRIGTDSTSSTAIYYNANTGESSYSPGYLPDWRNLNPGNYAGITGLIATPIIQYSGDQITAIRGRFLLTTGRMGYSDKVYELGIEGLTSSANNYTKYLNWIKTLVYAPPDDPFTPGGESGVGQGDATWDGTSDPVDFPSIPSISAAGAGLVTIFNPDQNQLKSFSDYLWGPLFDISTLKKLFEDPMDCIIGLSILPIAVPNTGVQELVIGNISTGVYMYAASAQYVDVDMGSVQVKMFSGSYLDFAPYTKISIYLPYIGERELNPDEVMGETIQLRYRVDILSGDCVAMIKSKGSVLYVFPGHCSTQIPINSRDWSEIIKTGVGILLDYSYPFKALNTSPDSEESPEIAHMSTQAMAAEGVQRTPSTVKEVMNAKVGFRHGGSIGGSASLMGPQTPYLIFTIPRQCLPSQQAYYTGYPSFITEKLSSLMGYTVVYKIHLENIPAADDEINEIERLLKGGVIF